MASNQVESEGSEQHSFTNQEGEHAIAKATHQVEKLGTKTAKLGKNPHEKRHRVNRGKKRKLSEKGKSAFSQQLNNQNGRQGMTGKVGIRSMPVQVPRKLREPQERDLRNKEKCIPAECMHENRNENREHALTEEHNDTEQEAKNMREGQEKAGDGIHEDSKKEALEDGCCCSYLHRMDSSGEHGATHHDKRARPIEGGWESRTTNPYDSALPSFLYERYQSTIETIDVGLQWFQGDCRPQGQLLERNIRTFYEDQKDLEDELKKATPFSLRDGNGDYVDPVLPNLDLEALHSAKVDFS